MRKSICTLAISAGMLVFGAAASQAQTMVMVGGEAMYPAKDIVTNAVNSKDHTTLVAAVKAAGLVETLQGKVPLRCLRLLMMPLKICPKER